MDVRFFEPAGRLEEPMSSVGRMQHIRDILPQVLQRYGLSSADGFAAPHPASGHGCAIVPMGAYECVLERA